MSERDEDNRKGAGVSPVSEEVDYRRFLDEIASVSEEAAEKEADEDWQRAPGLDSAQIKSAFANLYCQTDPEKLRKVFLHLFRRMCEDTLRGSPGAEEKIREGFSRSAAEAGFSVDDAIEHHLEAYARSAESFFSSTLIFWLDTVTPLYLMVAMSKALLRLSGEGFLRWDQTETELANIVAKEVTRLIKERLGAEKRGAPSSWRELGKEGRMSALREALITFGHLREHRPGLAFTQDNVVEIINKSPFVELKKPLTVQTFSRMLVEDGVDWIQLRKSQNG